MAALAGPVVAAACMVTPDTRLIRKVNDSKVLTRLQREGLLDSIKGRVVKVGIGAASLAEIHRLNIDHRKALRALGVTPFHRQDFGTVRVMLSAEQQIPLELEVAGVSPS